MNVSDSIKMLMIKTGKKRGDIAACLNIKPQAVSNKLYRNSFSAVELVKIADFCGVSLCFLSPDDNTRITFEIEDLTKK